MTSPTELPVAEKLPQRDQAHYNIRSVVDGARLEQMPYCLRVLVENVLRHQGRNQVSRSDLENLVGWTPQGGLVEVPFHPARVLMQDYTGIPTLVDLAALRDASARLGIDPIAVNPRIPVDLVIDHSLIVDHAGRSDAVALNLDKEYERNSERFRLAKWAQASFRDMRVVPPGSGILHQVNIEHIATVVRSETQADGTVLAFPDTMVGTDSHSTMVNALGVLGWGVGGIEAEAALLGLPLLVPVRRVVGVRLHGTLPEGVTTTDLVLTLTQQLRALGVIDAFVEFHGPALDDLTVADRATIANMAPEFGSTCAFFPVDAQTLRYLALTGRSSEQLALIEDYCKAQGLWRDAAHTPSYSAELVLDLSGIEPCAAGPKRPQDRVALPALRQSFEQAFPQARPAASQGLRDGSVVLAAITSCTNTSNPAVMLAAGLVAQKAVARGMKVPPWVKTSLTPGSRVVGDYLQASGLQGPLDALGFQVAGYGCGTCGGNSGGLHPDVEDAIQAQALTVCAVLSGNRNFEARIHPLAKASYLMSPPLVVAFALAGRVDLDPSTESLGLDANGAPVFLRDLWPSAQEIAATAERVLDPRLFAQSYAQLFIGDARWSALQASDSIQFPWDADSTYIRRPPYLDGFDPAVAPDAPDILGARVLVMLGDSVTTDHISPVGAIATPSPAGIYLKDRGVRPLDFNAYGSRRSNHEVMVRGTFANIRLRNELAGGQEGGVTSHLPTGEIMPIFDASQRYERAGTPLVIIAGKDYGAGSSRDWAAKGARLLGVRAVIAEGFERIHRSNLINMGVLPLQFPAGVTRQTLGLDGTEVIDLVGLESAAVQMRIRRPDGTQQQVALHPRLDTANERKVYRDGGMMPHVMRRLLAEQR